jgi:hypothetical protein
VVVVAAGWLIRRVKHKTPLESPLIIDSPGPDDFPRKKTTTH